jgi:hypothetical protein
LRVKFPLLSTGHVKRVASIIALTVVLNLVLVCFTTPALAQEKAPPTSQPRPGADVKSGILEVIPPSPSKEGDSRNNLSVGPVLCRSSLYSLRGTGATLNYAGEIVCNSVANLYISVWIERYYYETDIWIEDASTRRTFAQTAGAIYLPSALAYYSYFASPGEVVRARIFSQICLPSACDGRANQSLVYVF